jgi:hypothetical protein
MPCAQATAKKERDEYIRKNRRDLNEFEGVTDLVEVLKIIHQPRKYDPLINWIPYSTPIGEIYLCLTDAEASRLADYAEELIGRARYEEAEKICLCLSAFTNTSLDNCLRRFVSHGWIWPSFAFRRAPVDVVDELLTRVESDAESRNHILLALAWIGDSSVVEHFGKWRSNTPAWADSLYILPEDYSREAGWELTPDGKRRDLYFSQCYALKKGPTQSPESFRAVNTRSDKCPWCSSMLTNLFEVELAKHGFVNRVHGLRRIEVLTCAVCTAFGTIISNINDSGKAIWSPKNVRPDYLPDSPELMESVASR